MKQKIVFTDMKQIVPEIYYPKPASVFIPEWYKKTQSYINGSAEPIGDGTTALTVKKCMPVFDVMVAGYILVTVADIYVKQISEADEPEKLKPYYEWASMGAIDFHPVRQAEHHPKNNGFPFPKFISPWSIKTPKGFSILITAPTHRESVFEILPGIVDTDTYTNPVNFPFVLKDSSFTGLIPAGTPMAQIIPIKRENWQMEIGNLRDFEDSTKAGILLRTKFFNGYKTFFRAIKTYE